MRTDAQGHWQVWTASARLTGAKKLTTGPADSGWPVWSPDGTKILFLDNRIVRGRGRTGLATMRPNGTARAFLSPQSVESHQPDWESVH